MRRTDKNIILLAIVSFFAIIIWIILQFMPSRDIAVPIEKEFSENELSTESQNIDNPESESPQDNTPILPQISVTELSQLMNNNKQIAIVDTRSSDAFEAGHIRGSVSVHEIDSITPSTETIVLVSESGNEDLVMSYYRDLPESVTTYNLDGGMREWQSSGYTLISLQSTPNFASSGKIQFIEPRDLNTIRSEKNALEDIAIIDTRRPGNFEKGHIPNAINIPLAEVEYRHSEIPRDKDIYVYGADDTTSFQSGVLFYDLQFIGTKTVKGGFAAWEEYGYPVNSDQN